MHSFGKWNVGADELVGMLRNEGSGCGGDGDLCEECSCRRVRAATQLGGSNLLATKPRCSQNNTAAEAGPHRHKQPLHLRSAMCIRRHHDTERCNFVLSRARSISQAARFDMFIAFQLLAPALETLQGLCASGAGPFCFLSRCVQDWGGVQPCSAAAVPLISRRAD